MILLNMKKIYILGIAFFGFIGSSFGQTSYTWASSGSTSFSTTTNWSPNGSPGPIDDVIFNGSSVVNCNLDVSIDVNSISITSAYTGTIDGLANGHLIETSFSQAGGTFKCSSGNIDMVGALFSSTGGTFLHNSGDITFYPNTVSTFSIIGSITFNNLNISTTAPGNSTERFMNFGTCSANNLILAGGVKPYSYLGNVTILSSLTISGSNTGTPSTNSGTLTFSGAGPISITGAGAAARNKLPNLVFNTSGNISMSGHVNVQGNWTGTQGTLTVGSSTENFYGTSAAISGTAAAFDNLAIQSGASVSLPSNTEVKIGATLSNSGTLTFQTTSSLGFNGSGSQSTSALGGVTLAGINCYNTGSGRSVTLSGAIIVLDSIKAQTNVTLNTGGNLTLRSNSSRTARVAQSSGTVSGNVIAETFIPGGLTGWTNMGVRGIAGQTIGSWDTYVSSNAANGIPITCTGCAYSQTVLSSWFNSIQTWNEPNNTYDSITVSSALTPGKGFWVYVGDGATNTSGLNLINTGTVVQGNQSLALTNNSSGFNLLANPYPSPVSWGKIYNSGSNQIAVDGTIYVYNPDIPATTTYNANSSTSSHGAGITDIIPGGQGFYVDNSSGSISSLDFGEDVKVSNNTSASPLLKTASSTPSLFRLKVSGAADWDETAVCVHQNATNSFEKYDSKKLFESPGYVGYPGSYSKYTSISTKDADNKDYSINTLAPLVVSVNLPVLVKVSISGSYTISAKDFQNFGTCVGLVDKLDNSYHDLRLSPYVCSISDTTSSARFELVLCRDESLNTVGISEARGNTSNSIFITQDQQGALVKTAFAQHTKATISAYNIVGQKLMEDINVEGTVTNTRLNLNLHEQVVLIRVVSDKESSTKKIVIH